LDEAQQRIEAQAPLGEKLAVADYVIDTDGTLRETRRQAEEVWARLVAEHAALE
jgi:dephospho-CoA kinase